MARLLAAVAVIVAFLPAFASDPGQPLDCSDWVFLEPGYSCSNWIPYPCPSPSLCNVGSSGGEPDNVGDLYDVRHVIMDPNPSCGLTLYRSELVRSRRDHETVLAYVDERCNGPSSRDLYQPAGNRPTFDDKNGRMYVAMLAACNQCSLYGPGYSLLAINGFATTFEVLQTYTPSSSLSFRVPYMPEGLPAADHFDTYWGDLAQPIDFTHAHPLQCNYPASPPHVGDYLTVNDPLPNPSAGHGYYYLTSATYQGQTRYGRKASGGRLSGRDPAVPACLDAPTQDRSMK